MTTELAIPEHARNAPARYTMANSYMTERCRPNRHIMMPGVKFYDGAAVSDEVFPGDTARHANYLMYETRVWRTPEVLEAAEVLKQHGRLMVVGTPQSGKGTIIYGLSNICDAEGIGYALIDGHRQDTSADDLIAQIREANRLGKIIFFDSFDYLFGNSQKIRRLPKDQQATRTEQIVTALDNCSVPIVMTRHDNYWASEFLDNDLLAQHSEFISTAAEYHLSRDIQLDESRYMFLRDHELSDQQAKTLMGLADSEIVINYLTLQSGNGDYADELALALKDYATLKELVRARAQETHELLDLIASEDTQAAYEMARLILESHFMVDFLTTLRKTKN